MLYGGPLGTYLSGIGASSSSSNTAGGYLPSSGSSSSSSTGLKRSGSRYRSSLVQPMTGSHAKGSPISSSSPTRSGLSSSYFTPQMRRRGDAGEIDSTKQLSSRQSSHNNRYTTSSSSSLASSMTKQQPYHHHTPPYSSRRSSNTSSSPLFKSNYPSSMASSVTTNGPYSFTTTGGTGGSMLNTSNSWNSELNTVTSNPASLSSSAYTPLTDYKRLYELEKAASDELERQLVIEREKLNDLEARHAELERIADSRETDETRAQRRLAEYENQEMQLSNLRSERDKLAAEHRALVRVVSRLSQ